MTGRADRYNNSVSVRSYANKVQFTGHYGYLAQQGSLVYHKLKAHIKR